MQASISFRFDAIFIMLSMVLLNQYRCNFNGYQILLNGFIRLCYEVVTTSTSVKCYKLNKYYYERGHQYLEIINKTIPTYNLVPNMTSNNLVLYNYFDFIIYLKICLILYYIMFSTQK